MADGPLDPMTDLSEMAAKHHELFLTYVDAGFTTEQAFRVILEVIRTGLRNESD